jgi:hypothetical protein
MATGRLVCTALAALALGATAAVPARAATPVRGAALRDMRITLEDFIAPVAPEYVEGLRVRRAAVSSRDARFAAAWIELPYAGRQMAYLRRRASAWRVLDIGPARVGCGLVPDAVLTDLGGRCPKGV